MAVYTSMDDNPPRRRQPLDATTPRAGQSHSVEPMDPQPTQAILIVDDDPDVEYSFSRLLTLEGFTVYSSLSPEAGLGIAVAKHPDAIILDLRMPVLFKALWLDDLLALAQDLTAA